MRFRAALASTALFWSSAASVAATTGLLQPFEKWNVDYGDTQCTAGRSFGDPANPTILVILPALSGNSYELMISVPKAGPAYAHETHGAVDFGKGEIKTGVLYYGGQGVKLSAYQLRISASEMEQARSAGSLSVRPDAGQRYTFALSEMPEVLDGLRKCTADLEQYWNMDGKQAPNPAKTVLAELSTLFTAAEFPTEAQKMHEQGATRYQLMVDEKGSVAGCDVLASSGAPVLDSTGCDLIRRKARFTPATNSAGQPVRSVFTTSPLSWQTGPVQHRLYLGDRGRPRHDEYVRASAAARYYSRS